MSKKRKIIDNAKSWMSFSRLLHNDRLMMILAIVLAAVIWFSVISGPANIVSRSIPVTVTVDLGNTYVAKSGLRIVSENEFVVNVNVSGPWSAVSKLSDKDFRVRADLTTITGAGDINLPVNVSRNSSISDYDIVSVSPGTIPIVCDYWQESLFNVEIQTDALSVEPGLDKTIGEAQIDTVAVQDGVVTIDGPKSAVSKISKVVVRPTDTKPLSDEFKTYTVELMALDASGNEVDLTECTIQGLADKKVSVTVPLWESRQIEVKYTVEGLSGNLNAADYLAVKPGVLDVSGPTAELNEFEARVQNLNFGDITERSKANPSVSFPLEVRETMKIANGITSIEIGLDFDGGKVDQTEIKLLPSEENVLAESRDGHAYAVTVAEAAKPYSITLIGNPDSIAQITAGDLVFRIVTDDTTRGEYSAYLDILNYDDVWIQAGNNHTYKVKATLSVPTATPAGQTETPQ